MYSLSAKTFRIVALDGTNDTLSIAREFCNFTFRPASHHVHRILSSLSKRTEVSLGICLPVKLLDVDTKRVPVTY